MHGVEGFWGAGVDVRQSADDGIDVFGRDGPIRRVRQQQVDIGGGGNPQLRRMVLAGSGVAALVAVYFRLFPLEEKR